MSLLGNVFHRQPKRCENFAIKNNEYKIYTDGYISYTMIWISFNWYFQNDSYAPTVYCCLLLFCQFDIWSWAILINYRMNFYFTLVVNPFYEFFFLYTLLFSNSAIQLLLFAKQKHSNQFNFTSSKGNSIILILNIIRCVVPAHQSWGSSVNLDNFLLFAHGKWLVFLWL